MENENAHKSHTFMEKKCNSDVNNSSLMHIITHLPINIRLSNLNAK